MVTTSLGEGLTWGRQKQMGRRVRLKAKGPFSFQEIMCSDLAVFWEGRALFQTGM